MHVFKPVLNILLIWLILMTWITLSILVVPGGTDRQNILKSIVTLTAESVTFSGSRDSRGKSEYCIVNCQWSYICHSS